MIIKCMNIKKFLERNVVKFGFHADITYSCVQRSCVILIIEIVVFHIYKYFIYTNLE